jgi:transcription elongation GreA/GreB family factor
MSPRRETDKSELRKKIVASLVESLEVLDKAARASHAEATHESSRAENKYDTRGLEAAYLAGAQAKQAREILDSIARYEKLIIKAFAPGDAIDLTALVELETDGARSLYFIGPKNGSLEVRHGRQEIMVITPESPLGQNLLGRKDGERWTTRLNGAPVTYHIVSVK